MLDAPRFAGPATRAAGFFCRTGPESPKSVPADGATWQREAWNEGLELLRQLVPESLTEHDPVPRRQTIFRIAVQEVSGRAAIPPPRSPELVSA